MTSVALSPPQEVIIGVDPHPDTHTATALDVHGMILGELTITSDGDGVTELLGWAEQYRERRWAIEGAGNAYVELLIQKLVDRDELVFNIAPAVTAQYRSLRGRNKTDSIDAANAARALRANPQALPYQRSAQQRELQELTRAYRRVAEQLKAQRMALQQSTSAAVKEALQPVITALTETQQQLREAMKQVVEELCPQLLSVRGIGPVIAAVIVAEVGAIARFATPHKFAMFGGLAPIARQSGAREYVRVNSGGNRRLNWAVHMMVRSRLGVDERSRAYVERKVGEGKTRREAIRCLKTLVAREIYRVLKRSHGARAAGGA